MTTCVIFGGTGFIGSHLAKILSDNMVFDEIILADIAPVRNDFIFDEQVVKYAHVDVRDISTFSKLPKSVSFIANFAAIHREPGHLYNEYYETNIPGAENVCAWAEEVGCNEIVFTSSIAPYGPSEAIKTEKSIPTPVSAYGGSKLVAEKIHLAWQRGGDRRLLIVRPGVVFGPGERGNVTRLIQATLRRYFFYMGNRKTRKAGGYVKELVNSILWARNRIPTTGGVYLYNFTMEKVPTIEDYVHSVCHVAKIRRFIPSVPFVVLLVLSYIIHFVSRLLGLNQSINPVRIRKLVRSNNVQPNYLRRDGYVYKYSLESALNDWSIERPDEWC